MGPMIIGAGVFLAFIIVVVLLATFSDWFTERQATRKAEIKRLRAQVAKNTTLIQNIEQIAVDSRAADPSFDLIIAEIRDSRKEIEPQ